MEFNQKTPRYFLLDEDFCFLTFQLAQGNTIPRVNNPSIGPPHMPWMEREACGADKKDKLRAAAEGKHAKF